MSGRDQISFDGRTIEYEIRRSERRRKTIQITVEGRNVRVAAPLNASDDSLRGFVRKKAPWILTKTSQPGPDVPPLQMVDGEKLTYLGEEVLISQEKPSPDVPPVRLDGQRLRVASPAGPSEEAQAEGRRQAVIAWYMEKAADHLPSRVEHWWPKYGGETMSRVLIRNQRKRWASCASDGSLRFNWRIMMLPPELVDYIVVHELAHLTIRNHSPHFWQLVTRELPQVLELRKQLRVWGRTLPL